MSDRPIRVGVQLQPQHGTLEDMREAWLRVEQLGADTVFNWDHFFPLRGDPDGNSFEAWTVQAAMAESTSRIQVGCLVTCNSYRNANLQAYMAGTVDHISGGRFIFGIGAGWFQRDYDEYGYEFGTAPDRLRHLDRSMAIIVERWKKLHPPPVNGRPPILIGGGGEKVTLRITAQYADIWNGFGLPDVAAHKGRVLDEHCERLGRDPGEIERSIGGIGADRMPLLDDYVAAGVTHFIMGVSGPDWNLDLLSELIAYRDKRNAGLGSRAAR
jgi:probable F420-dependent oxidoreductase